MSELKSIDNLQRLAGLHDALHTTGTHLKNVCKCPLSFVFPQCPSNLVDKSAGHRLRNPCSKHGLPVWGLAHPTLTNSILLDILLRNVQHIRPTDQTDHVHGHDQPTNLIDRPNQATNLKHCTHVDFVYGFPGTTSSVKSCRYGQGTKLVKRYQREVNNGYLTSKM